MGVCCFACFEHTEHASSRSQRSLFVTEEQLNALSTGITTVVRRACGATIGLNLFIRSVRFAELSRLIRTVCTIWWIDLHISAFVKENQINKHIYGSCSSRMNKYIYNYKLLPANEPKQMISVEIKEHYKCIPIKGPRWVMNCLI